MIRYLRSLFRRSEQESEIIKSVRSGLPPPIYVDRRTLREFERDMPKISYALDRAIARLYGAPRALGSEDEFR